MAASAIGELRTIQLFFTHVNADAANMRNVAAIGGGRLLDTGGYNLNSW